MKRKIGEKDIERAIRAVHEFEEHLEMKGKTFESAAVEDVKKYLSLLMSQGKNSARALEEFSFCHQFF